MTELLKIHQMDKDKNKEPIKKEVGGIKLPDGIALGPMFFSKDGRTANAIIGPAIIAFDYGITNSLNRLDKDHLPIDEFQSAFNSQIDDLISEILIYFQNRLKVICKTNVGQFNSVDRCVKEYQKYSIDLGDLCDLNFLLDIDRVRGRKHHSDRRYDNDYTINAVVYDSIGKLRALNRRVHKEIHGIDSKLALTHKDYEIKVSQTANSVSLEFTADSHTLDFTRGAKVVPKKPDDPKKSG